MSCSRPLDRHTAPEGGCSEYNDNTFCPLRRRLAIISFAAAVLLLLPLCLFIGQVDIPFAGIWDALTGAGGGNPAWHAIVVESRLPAVLTATIAGATLSVAGLLLQTTFSNPLAGPSIMGVSTGASLGVATVLLCSGAGAVASVSLGVNVAVLLGALAGAVSVILVLLFFSAWVKSSMVLLIIGILVNYLTSSAIALLNFFSTQEGVHSFVVWGLGNFYGVGQDAMPLFAIVAVVLLLCATLMVKPLNALLLGERYARSMGVNTVLSRNILLLLSGALTALPTAWCGPVGFIGLVVPHLARMATGTGNHAVLLPASALCGAAVGELTLLIGVLPSSGYIPVNAVTPLIGVPVIIYIIMCRKKIFYFN